MSEPDSGVKIDLWGAAFLEDPRESAPVTLLQEQAEALTRRTGGRVEGIVLKEADGGTVWASLYARVPALQGYMHKLVNVAHSVTADPDDPSPLSVHATFNVNDGRDEIRGMEEFRLWLANALSSEEAHAVIVNLLRYIPERAAS